MCLWHELTPEREKIFTLPPPSREEYIVTEAALTCHSTT